MTLGAQFISFLSGEWMLLRGRPNGGDVVVFRTLWVGSLLIFFLAAILATEKWNGSVCALLGDSWTEALKMLRSSHGPLVYGAVYLALYARFTSQWTYMANLYNQIKQVEVTTQQGASFGTNPALAAAPIGVHTSPSAAATPSPQASATPSPLTALAQWKAGYIEDAYATHMATKPIVAGVIRAWYADPAVVKALQDHTANYHEMIGWMIKHSVL